MMMTEEQASPLSSPKSATTTDEEEEYVEVEVGGKLKIKKHHMVKSLVTAFEKQGEVLTEKKIDRITEEEWRLIRDTKIQASGKWLTRDKDGNRVVTVPPSPRPRSSTGVLVDRITAGAMASRKDSTSRSPTVNASPRSIQSSSSSPSLVSPRSRGSSSSGELRTTRKLSFAAPPQFLQSSASGSESPSPRSPSQRKIAMVEAEANGDTSGEVSTLDDKSADFISPREGSSSQELVSLDSPYWCEAGTDITTKKPLGAEESTTPRQSGENEDSAAPSVLKSKSASGDRPRKKVDQPLRKSKRSKSHRKQRSKQRVDVYLSETSASGSHIPTEVNKDKGELAVPKKIRSRSLSGDDVSVATITRHAEAAATGRKLPPLNLASGDSPEPKISPFISCDVPLMTSSPSTASRGRTATALASLFSKVSNWTDKSDRLSRDRFFTSRRERRQSKQSSKLSVPDPMHPRNHSGSDLAKSGERPVGKGPGRSWGKYEGVRMFGKASEGESQKDGKEHRFSRSISFDSCKKFTADESGNVAVHAEGPSKGSGRKESNLILSQEFDTASRINASLVSRSSYQDLVDRGIVREWNEDRDLRRCSTTLPSNLEEEIQREGLQLHVKDTGDEVCDDLIISDDQNSWHSERGSESDFVMGAFPALEDDQHYTLLYKKYFYNTDHTNYCATDPEFGPVIVSIEDKVAAKEGERRRGPIMSLLNINQTIQYFENMSDQSPTTPRGRDQQRRERLAASQTASVPSGFAPALHHSDESTRVWSESSTISTKSVPSTSTSSKVEPLLSPRIRVTPASDDQRSTGDKPRPRLTASFRGSRLTGGGNPTHTRTMSTPPKPATISQQDKHAREGDGAENLPETKPERSQTSLFLNKLGLSNNENRLDNYRTLIQTRKGARMIFIRSGPRAKDKLKALKVACGVMGYLPEIQSMRFKAINVDIRDELLKLERSFNSQNYKFGVLYCKKGQGENEMFTNATSDSNKGWERFLDFLGDRIALKGWKNYTGGLDVKNETTGEQSIYTEFREQKIMFHVSTMLPFFPFDVQQVERKRHLGNDIVVIVYLEPGAQFSPQIMTTQFNHIYCVVRMDNVDDEVPAVRVEYAAKAGVRPFGPKLPSSKPFLLDNAFREFFLTKLINGERAALCAPVFAVKLEKTRRALMNELVSKLLK